MLLMIDNYDSFTYNVVQYLAELGADVQVHRNDEITTCNGSLSGQADDGLAINHHGCGLDCVVGLIPRVNLMIPDQFTGLAVQRQQVNI